MSGVDARDDTPDDTESGLSYRTKLEPSPARKPPSSSESSPVSPFPFFFSRRLSGSVHSHFFFSLFSFCSSVLGSSSVSEALWFARRRSSFSLAAAGLFERRLARPKLNGENARGSRGLGLAISGGGAGGTAGSRRR